MRQNILRFMQYGYTVELIYTSKSGEITKRKVKIHKVSEDTFQGYCFKRKEMRNFIIDQVLAILPVMKKEQELY